MYDLIRQHMPEAEAVGGLTMGADPLVSNTASASAWYVQMDNVINYLLLHPEKLELLTRGEEIQFGKDLSKPAPKLLQGFLVRKAEKTHGTGRKVEGFLKPGAKVVIVDDVCTTGGSTITAIESAREAGMVVVGVLCLVDREQGGRANIEKIASPAPFISLFTANDVRAAKIGQNK